MCIHLRALKPDDDLLMEAPQLFFYLSKQYDFSSNEQRLKRRINFN